MEKIRASIDQGGRAVILVECSSRGRPRWRTSRRSCRPTGCRCRTWSSWRGTRADRGAEPALPHPQPGAARHPGAAAQEQLRISCCRPARGRCRPLELKKRSLKIEPLLTSSAKSCGIRDIPSTKTLARVPPTVGTLHTCRGHNGRRPDPSRKDTKLIVAGDIQFLGQSLTSQVPGNSEFFMNSLGWLRGQKQTITIRQEPAADAAQPHKLQAILYSALVVILVPALVLGGVRRADEEAASMSRRGWTLLAVLVVLGGLIGVPAQAGPAAANTPPQLLKGDKEKLVKVQLTGRRWGSDPPQEGAPHGRSCRPDLAGARVRHGQSRTAPHRNPRTSSRSNLLTKALRPIRPNTA